MKKSLFVVACLALLLSLGVFAAACGQSGGGTSGGSKTPKQVVTTFLNDLKTGNYADAYKQLSAADQKQGTEKQFADAYAQQGKPPADLTFSATSEKISGNKAVVQVKESQGGQSQNMSVALVKEGGAWKISSSDTQGLNQQ